MVSGFRLSASGVHFRRVVRTAAALSLSVVGACASLIAPTVRAEPAALKEGAYTLDQQHAALLFKVGHLGFSKFIGRFEKFDVALDFDENDPTAARIDAIIDVASLDIANDDFAETLRGPDWFDAEGFPEARFVSRSIEVTGDNEGVLYGDFTMRGVTRPIEMDVTFNGGGYDVLRGAYVLGMSATSKIKRSEFGMSKFRPLVRNTVEIEIEAEFLRRGDVEPTDELAINEVVTEPKASIE
ncbi:MAG: YceI family protein [Pseudomonadota bacterium]